MNFGRRPIAIARLEGLSLAAYRPDRNGVDVYRFAPAHFASASTYKRLMLLTSFYTVFRGYRHVLIHQLVAFVFSDQLSAWCQQGWDYIGAPWIGSAAGADENRASWLGRTRDNIVGNGRFSLRRTEACLDFLERFAVGVVVGLAHFTTNPAGAVRITAHVHGSKPGPSRLHVEGGGSRTETIDLSVDDSGLG